MVRCRRSVGLTIKIKGTLTHVVFVHCRVCYSTTDLKTAETKDDILAQLNKANVRFDDIDQEQLDDEIKSGSAQSLARSLHHRLLVRPLLLHHHQGNIKGNSKRLSYFQTLNTTSTLQVMVLCNVIDQLIRRSDLSMSDYGPQFVDDLSASLPRVVKILALGESESSCHSTIRFVTISSCIRIMRRIVTAASASPFIDALLILFNDRVATTHVPSDILIDAACAITSFVLPLVTDKKMIAGQQLQQPTIIDKVVDKSNSDALLAILGAAVSTDSLQGIALDALWQLGQISVIGEMMAKRRSLVTAANKHLNDGSADIRKKAIALIGLLVANYSDDKTPFLFECNLTLISRSLTKASLKEGHPKLRMSMLEVLMQLIKKEGLDFEHSCQIMETFFKIATSTDTEEESAMESALAYLFAASYAAHTVDVLSSIVNFTTSPYAKVRATSLALLKDITFWKPDSATLLLSATSMIESFSLIVTHGSDADCCLVVEISKQIVFETRNHASFCGQSEILAALVRLVTTEPITNRAAYTLAIGVLLDLTSTQLVRFLPYSNVLLPWLVKLANRTSDEDMKARLISTIVRLSSAILE